MLRIRLRRVGKKKQPMYRIVVADSRSPRDGAFVESIGYYHPLDNPSTIVLDEERARHWLDKGAMPSDRVAKILNIQGLAEIPPKLAARIALGGERAKEATAAKAKATEAAAEAPEAAAASDDKAKPAEAAAEAPEAAAASDDKAKPAEAAAEAPAAEGEAPAEAPAEEPAAEAEAQAAEAASDDNEKAD